VFFKKADDSSYLLFRKVTQLIDIISLDYMKLNFTNREVVASSLILTLLENSEIISINNSSIITSKQIQKFTSSNNRPEVVILCSTFNDFLFQSFNFKLEDLDSSLKFVQKYIAFLGEAVVDIPLTVQMAPEDDTEINNVSFILFLFIYFNF
jgi:hypothetical protein